MSVVTCLPYRSHFVFLTLLGLAIGMPWAVGQDKAAVRPLRALLVCGGCCHDYAAQSVILRDGIQARANVQVDVVRSESTEIDPGFPMYQNPDWAKGYDVVIHDECAAEVKDPAIISHIIAAHRTVAAVNLHCAMHSYRGEGKDWFKYIGLQSTGHGPQEPIAIDFIDKEHPITRALENWNAGKEELYNNVELFGAHPLATGTQMVDGKEMQFVVAWTNESAGAKSFSTTIGHNNATVSDGRYLDLVTRGLLWAAGRLSPEYQIAYTGPAGKVLTIPAPAKQASGTSSAPPPAKDGTPVTITASSEQSGESNFIWKIADGSAETRWCAANGRFPAWVRFEFPKPQVIGSAKILWEGNGPYQYQLESSDDGKLWKPLVDASGPAKEGNPGEHAVEAREVRFVRLTVLGAASQAWASVREVSFPGIKSLSPVVPASQARAGDPYAKEGNVPPRIVKLTPQQEAEILKDVQVPDGFEVSLFAAPPAANYPVYLAAAPDGDLYVSSDGNGSLGRNPKRGRILRLRDTDHDGRADEVKEFVKEVDSPRGLVWDKDRLYLIHPPDLSVFIDKDGDGIADEEKVLVKDIAFGFKDRPADHTTNGLGMGVDGWLYIAGGDFGFMKATGADGKMLQHRGGGVIRVRPDGSDLEIYATGTRNILEVAIDPQMEMFARDNTNDGGGWDVRFHHFGGYGDHGYPRLYKNFNEEIIQPLADYGGGSGCGAVYLDEPGFGGWNQAPLTNDWGTGALWRHGLVREGATFKETEAPKPFIKMTRPTDTDVDAMSHVYQASWKGASFDWAGPNPGYIVRVSPKGYTAGPLPDFDKAGNRDLVKLLESPSNRRRVEAQRELLRRGLPDEAIPALVALISDPAKPIAARTVALLAFTHFPEKSRAVYQAIGGLAADPDFDAIVVRGIAETAASVARSSGGSLTLRSAWKDEPATLAQLNRVVAASPDWNLATRQAIFGLTLGSSDAVVRHTAFQALAKLGDVPLAFAYVDGPAPLARETALLALARIHEPKAVDGLIERLGKATDPALRQGLLSSLCRLHFREGEWKGDSWGTRPDTRGPYYQAEAWGETPKIAAALKMILATASPAETAFLVKELNRNRIQSDDALQRIIALAKQDSKLAPEVVSQLAIKEEVPADAVPLLVGAAATDPAKLEPTFAAALISNAVIALTRTDSSEGCRVSLSALAVLEKIPGSFKESDAARAAFLAAPKLENHHQLLEAEAEKTGTAAGLWADAALLKLSDRKTGSPEAKELSAKALEAGWRHPKRRVQILRAVAAIKFNPYAERVLASLDDADPEVAGAAKNAASVMKLEKNPKAAGPLVGALKQEEVIARILETRGDVSLGEQVFSRASCITCHTTSESEIQKGPYLGHIARTYQRRELAEAILEPDKTIAQGFATNLITTKDGTTRMGFVTFESAEKVTLRGITGEETSLATAEVVKREKPPMSMMPTGIAAGLSIHEFASLLDYLENLAKQ